MTISLRVVIWGALCLAGCSSTTSGAHDADAHAPGDTGADIHADVGCAYPDVRRDPGCPAGHQDSCGSPCSTPGLACAYPGVGDGPDPQGCLATAMAWCLSPAFDAGSAAIWICAQ
jgi:hypothetical protein